MTLARYYPISYLALPICDSTVPDFNNDNAHLLALYIALGAAITLSCFFALLPA